MVKDKTYLMKQLKLEFESLLRSCSDMKEKEERSDLGLGSIFMPRRFLSGLFDRLSPYPPHPLLTFVHASSHDNTTAQRSQDRANDINRPMRIAVVKGSTALGRSCNTASVVVCSSLAHKSRSCDVISVVVAFSRPLVALLHAFPFIHESSIHLNADRRPTGG